jgi:O-succinylbenzoate synthase
MATAYDTWKTDAPYDAEGEWVAERAEELAQEMAANEKAVTEALDNACGFTDYSDRFTADLARFFIAYDKAKTNESCAQAADDLFRALHPHVIGQIASEAHTKAELEWMNRQTGPEDVE